LRRQQATIPLKSSSSPRPDRSVSWTFVAAVILAFPRFPPLNKNGKEGVDGSSPSERALQRPRKTGSFCIRADLHLPRSLGCGKRVGKTGPSAHTHPPPHGACP